MTIYNFTISLIDKILRPKTIKIAQNRTIPLLKMFGIMYFFSVICTLSLIALIAFLGSETKEYTIQYL